MAEKATKAESEQRTNEVYVMLLTGASRQEIIEYASKWDIGVKAVDYYIGKANARFEQHAAVIRDRELGKSIARLNKLYLSLVRIQDYKGALSVQKELNTLLGLHAPSKVQHSGSITWAQFIADHDANEE